MPDRESIEREKRDAEFPSESEVEEALEIAKQTLLLELASEASLG